MPNRTSTARRIFAAIQPDEAVVVLFLLYMARFDWTGARLPPGSPKSMFAAVTAAILLRQLAEHRRRAWSHESHAAAFYRRLTPLAEVAIGAVGLSVWSRQAFAPQAPTLAAWLMAGFGPVRNVLDAVLPLGAVWLGLGLHLKRQGEVVPRALARSALGAVVSAVRAWASPVVMVFLYGYLSAALGNLHAPDRDAALAAVDRWLALGHNPVHALESVVSRPLSEWMAFSYAAYVFVYPVCFGALYAISDRRAFTELALAVTATLALGFIGYTLVPARGPMFAEHFSVRLDGYYLEDIKAQLVDTYRAPRDCFPSLHTAVSLVFLWAAYRHLRPLFWALLPVVLSMPIACLYLRYHYLADVLAGVALAAAVCPLSAWVLAKVERAAAPG